MKTRKNINSAFFFTFLFVLFFGLTLQAQQDKQQGRQQGPPPLPDSSQIIHMVDELAKELSLTETQKARVSDLHFDHFKEAEEMNEQNRSAKDANREKFEKQILTILNDKQKINFEAFIKNRKAPQHENRRSPRQKQKK